MADTLQHGLGLILGLVATLLGLSVAVEILQEIFKYLTTAKARAYRKALRDFIGVKLTDTLESKKQDSLHLRGPFQWRPSRAPVKLLPMDKPTLLHAIKRAQPEILQSTLGVLVREAETQAGQPAPPSKLLRRCVRRLWPKVNEDGCASATFNFLEEWGVTLRPTDDRAHADVTVDAVDAHSLVNAFSQVFVPKWQQVEDEFDQFSVNFDYWYRRRNLRITFVFGFLLAVALKLPFDDLYQRVAGQSPEQLTQVAQSTIKLYERRQDEATPGNAPGTEGTSTGEKIDTELEDLNERLRDSLRKTLNAEADKLFFLRGWCYIASLRNQSFEANQRESGCPQPSGQAKWPKPPAGWEWFFTRLAQYLFYCLVTALLISFGAPFWHRITKTLLGLSMQLNAARDQRRGETHE